MNGKHVTMFEFVIFSVFKKKFGKVPETKKNANMLFWRPGNIKKREIYVGKN